MEMGVSHGSVVAVNLQPSQPILLIHTIIANLLVVNKLL